MKYLIPFLITLHFFSIPLHANQIQILKNYGKIPPTFTQTEL